MNPIRSIRPILVFALFLGVSIAPSLAAKAETAAAAKTFPANALSLVPGSERLADESYARLVAGDAIVGADPEVLFHRMMTASLNGENYKALYLARIITARTPDNSATWSNRALVAEALGFAGEAQACRQNAENPVAPTAVPGEMLPGAGRLVAPATLGDWAAAMSLMADDLRAKGASRPVVAVKNNLFGTDVVNGPSGPETKDRLLLVDGILPNSFAMSQADPMNPKRVNGGFLVAGILAGLTGLAGSHYNDANMAARGSELYGQSMAAAIEVDSTLEGGRYKAHTFPGGKATVATREPKPSGKNSAVDWPLPVMFASGKSTSAMFEGHWAKHGKSADKKVARKGGAAKAGSFKSQDLSFLKLATFRDPSGKLLSAPVTAFELMLSPEDLEALGGVSLASRRPNLEAAENAYRNGAELVLDPLYTGKGVVGIAADGSAYAIELGPRSWVVKREIR